MPYGQIGTHLNDHSLTIGEKLILVEMRIES